MTVAQNIVALNCFITLFISRYLRTIVGVFTYITYKPKPIHEKPRFTAQDVTVIIPSTFKAPGELIQCLRSIINSGPALVVVVTSRENVELVKTCCCLNSFKQVRVVGVPHFHKRLQMIRGLEEVETEVTVFADDDVFWPPGYIDYLLAVFEDPAVGAGGTRQRARRAQDRINCWNFLGISYLERRVWNNVCTNVIDGSLSTLSGRTAAYLTHILQTPEFQRFFLDDSWSGHRLNSDDDKCLTRFVYSRGFRITLQFDPRAVIETSLEDNPRYIFQCLRWARAHWRGNLTVMRNESYWCSWKHWWGAYAIYIGQFQTPALVVDALLLHLLWAALETVPEYKVVSMALLGCWISVSKVLKLIPHFYHCPSDLRFLPVSLIFSYLHGLLNIYVLCTLHVTTWGTQNLEELRAGRAKEEEVIPLLRSALATADPYSEPTTGRIMMGDDYFSAIAVPSQPEARAVEGGYMAVTEEGVLRFP